MIKFENTQVVGWEPAIRGMRNPLNSWAKSDTIFFDYADNEHHDILGNSGPVHADAYANWGISDFDLGPNDYGLMMRLDKAGSVDAKFMRMIVVYVDITAPLYWWKEFDTYKVGTVANSCSTMHKIHSKEFTLDDFSHEHLNSVAVQSLETTIAYLNMYRKLFNDWDDVEDDLKRSQGLTEKRDAWWQMIQLLPTCYNQKRTVMLNYEVLAGIYPKRLHHKLDEWRAFCDWIHHALPYDELITCRSWSEEKKTYISEHDKLVFSAYTGYLVTDWDKVHKFIEETIGRPVLTHELGSMSTTTVELQNKLHNEFVTIFGAPKTESYTAFIYEDDGTTTKDLSTYDNKEDAIELAKCRNWDEVVNDGTGEVVWRKGEQK